MILRTVRVPPPEIYGHCNWLWFVTPSSHRHGKKEERNRKDERNFRQTKAGRVNGDKENGVEGDKVRSGRKGEDDQVTGWWE